MGFMTEKYEEKESNKTEQTELIQAAVSAAISPLFTEITFLKKEIKNLKEETFSLKGVVDSPNYMKIDDETKTEIKKNLADAASGVDSYKIPIYALFVMVIILGVSIVWNSHRLNEIAENMDWKYDSVTSILSGDRHYWWDGENYQTSRNAPETKRLKEALDRYQKINEQMKKQSQ
ncbi:MAG: hypothetical protein KBF19_01485 [Negativicutes bacterium]|nr:hypothetical protein [Negativicutes bacterium]